jgi:hypothetical protein
MQLEWTEAELLATHHVTEPVFAAGRRCHGGFDEHGGYVSPRIAGRGPAITAWQAHHRDQFGTEIAEAPLDQWPTSYPNLAQAQLLLRHGVTAPIATILTRIGTVEGFGGLIRTVGCGDLQRHLAEPIKGTALAHLETGLFEAHARDETGFGDEIGHKEMWFAARDIAFDRPYSADETAEMMSRMGVPAAGSRSAVQPLFPTIDQRFEAMFRFMLGLMFIEVSAFHTFAWAEALLDDRELCAGDGNAAEIVRYIRSDETPHVEYLRTAISEVRDRTIIDTDGKHVAGSEFIERIWTNAMGESLGARRVQFVDTMNGEVAQALATRPDGDDVFEEFLALTSPDRVKATARGAAS